LKRLSVLSDSDLKAELIKNLKIVFIKDADGVFRVGEKKDGEPAKDPDSLSSTMKDVLSAAPPIAPRYQSGAAGEAEPAEAHPHKDLFSDNMLLIIGGCVVVGLLLVLVIFWSTIEEFLSGVANIMGMIVLLLIVMLLSLYSTD
jgi:hypothetical protein